jgi:putative nucleotidyltransferase with HDIG domain
MAALHLRTIETLALAIDAKDETTAAHLRRVQIYAAGIGKELELSQPEMQALNAAALLHDVGKLAVPEYIIFKPGKLTLEEFEKMKVHPVVGAEILERVNFPYPVVPIVRSHHEKYDGARYPEGLVGDQIPIGARILSVVDCLDALASDRQYRQALPLDEAMEIVTREAGKAFDPNIVATVQRMYRELEKEAKSQTADRAKLSTHVKITRGLAPATGLAIADAQLVSEPVQENDFQPVDCECAARNPAAYRSHQRPGKFTQPRRYPGSAGRAPE